MINEAQGCTLVSVSDANLTTFIAGCPRLPVWVDACKRLDTINVRKSFFNFTLHRLKFHLGVSFQLASWWLWCGSIVLKRLTNNITHISQIRVNQALLPYNQQMRKAFIVDWSPAKLYLGAATKKNNSSGISSAILRCLVSFVGFLGFFGCYFVESC